MHKSILMVRINYRGVYGWDKQNAQNTINQELIHRAEPASHYARLPVQSLEEDESCTSDDEHSKTYNIEDDSLTYNQNNQSIGLNVEINSISEHQKHPPTAKELILSHQMGYDSGLNAFVNKELWRVTKFMSPKDEYDPNSNLARFCYRSLRISDNQQALWWKNSWSKMKKILSKKRTSVTQRMMKVFKGKKKIFSIPLQISSIFVFQCLSIEFLCWIEKYLEWT